MVKAVVENLEKDQVKIDIEVDASEFEKAVEKAYLKNRGAIAIPGFRKGKAPRKIIERFYGEGVFHEDAFELLFPKAYYKAISENGLKPADEPSDIDMVQIGNGQDLKFSVKVQLEPKPELGEYKGVEIVKMQEEVTEEDIANELNRLKEEHARWIEKEDGAALEDRVSISVDCYVDDEPVEEIAPKKQLLPLGLDIYLPGFDAELIGMKPGEQKQFEYTLSDDYTTLPDYAGKSVTFHVTMDEIKYRELPELDDEFAKDVSEYDTLEELKDSIRIRLQKEKREFARNANLSRLLGKIHESTKVDIPDNMIDDRVESMIHESEHRTQALFGKTLKELDEIKYISLDDMRESYKQQAYIEIKNELILDEIARKEMLLATEDEIEAKLPKSFSSGWKSFELDNNKEINILENLKDAITRRKVMEYLMENAVFVEENTIDGEKSAEGEADLNCAVETEGRQL